MKSLEELAPGIDLDEALASFTRERSRRRRVRAVTRASLMTLTVLATITTVMLVAYRPTDQHVTLVVSGPSTTVRTSGFMAWPTPNAAIDAYLRTNPTTKERARVKFDENTWILIAEGLSTGNHDSAWTVGDVQVPRGPNGWTPNGTGVAGMLDRCFSLQAGNLTLTLGPRSQGDRPFGPPVFRPDYVYAVTADPRWLIQAFFNGHWMTLPTTHGVYFKIQPHGPNTEPPNTNFPGPKLRPIKPDGHVPRCFANRYPNLAK